MSNVRKATVERNLCVSCGICKAVCPHSAIEYAKEDGIYIPTINENCTICELCIKVCPGVVSDYPELYKMAKENIPDNLLVGNVKKCYVAKAKNDKVLFNATSGAIITTLILELLNQKKYHTAFCVDSYAYDKQLTTSQYFSGEDLKDTQKSRYLSVSHENLIKYMRKNPNEKIIITAVPCAMQGIIKAIDLYKLNRDNYLLLGLFCDKTMSYHINDYFKNKVQNNITELYFRDKQAGGWPGNISMRLDTGKRIELPAKERMKVKQFFQMERCLYCIDKLNQFADISVGDNYTGIEKTVLGSSSVIVRTEKGESAWGDCEDLLESKPIMIEDITRGQHIENRYENLKMAVNYRKRHNHKINITPQEQYETLDDEVYTARLRDIDLGRNYLKEPNKVHKNLRKKEKEANRTANIIRIRTVLGKVKRKLGL